MPLRFGHKLLSKKSQIWFQITKSTSLFKTSRFGHKLLNFLLRFTRKK